MTIKLKDRTALKADLDIVRTQLNEECARQPGLFSHYSEQHTNALADYQRKKLEFEVYEAALDKQIRDQALARREKLTEVQIERRMLLNDEYIRRKKELIDYETVAAQIGAIVKSLAQKKDMLVTITANNRNERSTGMRVDEPPEMRIPLVEPQH